MNEKLERRKKRKNIYSRRWQVPLSNFRAVCVYMYSTSFVLILLSYEGVKNNFQPVLVCSTYEISKFPCFYSSSFSNSLCYKNFPIWANDTRKKREKTRRKTLLYWSSRLTDRQTNIHTDIRTDILTYRRGGSERKKNKFVSWLLSLILHLPVLIRIEVWFQIPKFFILGLAGERLIFFSSLVLFPSFVSF